MRIEEKPIFYDTDCLSCFISIDDTSILESLFEKVLIPEDVYDEFSRVKKLKERVDILIECDFIEVIEWNIDSVEYDLYLSLSSNFLSDTVIGNGEAAAIALAKANNGIIASNNLKDIMKYVRKFNLDHITTGDIIVMAYDRGLLSEDEGNILWHKMLKRKRYLPTEDFSTYLKKFR